MCRISLFFNFDVKKKDVYEFFNGKLGYFGIGLYQPNKFLGFFFFFNALFINSKVKKTMHKVTPGWGYFVQNLNITVFT